MTTDVMTTGVKVSVVEDVGAAKLNMASQVPMEQRRKAAKIRGLKKPNLELRFFCIDYFEIGRCTSHWLPLRLPNESI